MMCIDRVIILKGSHPDEYIEPVLADSAGAYSQAGAYGAPAAYGAGYGAGYAQPYGQVILTLPQLS